MYRNLGFGDYPAVSPSGKYVAYNPEGDPRFSQRPGIPPIIVKEVATGKEIRFASIPEETRPWPGSRWSADETLIAFEVHDFEGNRSQAVVSVEDGSFWRGTREEFRVRYASAFPEVSSPLSVQSVTGQPDYHGWAANAVFYHPDSGPPVRLTPENMWISSSLGTAVWIERTGEVVFPAVWHSDLEISGPIEKRASPTPTIFVIKARARDWRNASREEWDAAALFEAEQVSCSR